MTVIEMGIGLANLSASAERIGLQPAGEINGRTIQLQL